MDSLTPCLEGWDLMRRQFPKERILTEEGEHYEKENGEGKAPIEYEIFSRDEHL